MGDPGPASSTSTAWSGPSTSSSWRRASSRRTTSPACGSSGGTGDTLQEHWAGEPRAFLGITVPGFPNFFMLYGPGTNGGEIVSMLETQAEYAVRAIKRMGREGVSAIEVRPSFEAVWTWLQSKMKGTSWTMSNNYFKSATGKIVTQWPSGNLVYRALTKLSGRVSETSLAATPACRAPSYDDDSLSFAPKAGSPT